jgi:hypothetical protein
MAGNKKSSGDISKYFDSGVDGTPHDAGKTPQPNSPVKPGKKLPTSFRIEDGYLDALKILSWRLVMPSMTATVNRALKEFIESNREALEEAKAQLGEDGVRDLLARKE